MTNIRIVFCTCASEDEAARIARSLVEGDLAACVQVSSPLRSYYRWQGELHEDTEWLLSIKANVDRFDAIRSYIESVHSYEVPEIIAVPVTEASERYATWLNGGSANA